MSETSKCVGLNDEQATTPDLRNAVQLTSLTDSGSAIDALPPGPEILFVAAPDKALEVDAPNHISRLHEIQRRKRNTDCCSPPDLRDAGLGGPDTIPTGITITVIGGLLFGDQSISLPAYRIYLKH